ncbi:seminase-like [Musca vetustissima]|uniref:seminase-like n=1 Tax=Musca vetustissima TaxID=27455 RepID=UPI002AB6AF72|nr:seminase-like [Musca vetustissima]
MFALKAILAVCLLAVVLSKAKANKTPYLVQFLDKKGNVFCVGTLIRPQYVVTAAHCFPNEDGSKTTVIGGSGSGKSEDEIKRSISAVKIHDDYGARTMHSDVAVVKLNDPMEGDSIKTIEMCSNDLRRGIFLQIPGWNQANSKQPLSKQLRTISARYAPDAMCKKLYGRYVDHDSMFCVFGKEVKGHCVGDSGSPAIYRDEFCGINAFGHWCNHGGQPNALTSVYRVRDFIEKAIEELEQLNEYDYDEYSEYDY